MNGTDLATQNGKALEGVIGGVEGGAAAIDLAAFVEQPPDELVLADFILSPLVPQNALHDCHRIGCWIIKDQLVALLADGPEQMRCRLGLHAVGEHTVVVVPDPRK